MTILNLDKFRSISSLLTLEVQRENTPYSSSEHNKSDIVNRQVYLNVAQVDISNTAY